MCLNFPEGKCKPTHDERPLQRHPSGCTPRVRQEPTHMQHALHARMQRTQRTTTTHKRPRTARLAWPPALPPCLPPHLPVKVSPVPLRAKADYPIPTGDCVTPHTHKHARGATLGAAASGTTPPPPPTTPCLSKCPPCCRGKGRLIQFQTINRSAIKSSRLSKS